MWLQPVVCLAQGFRIAISHLFHVHSRTELIHVSWILRSRFLTVIKEIKVRQSILTSFVFTGIGSGQCELRQQINIDRWMDEQMQGVLCHYLILNVRFTNVKDYMSRNSKQKLSERLVEILLERKTMCLYEYIYIYQYRYKHRYGYWYRHRNNLTWSSVSNYKQ